VVWTFAEDSGYMSLGSACVAILYDHCFMSLFPITLFLSLFSIWLYLWHTVFTLLSFLILGMEIVLIYSGSFHL